MLLRRSGGGLDAISGIFRTSVRITDSFGKENLLSDKNKIVEVGDGCFGAGRESNMPNRLPHDLPFLPDLPLAVHPFARTNKTEMHPQPDGRNLPRVTIFAESGPLAGDLAACLSGRFDIDRVTSPRGALRSLARGCQALIILRGVQEDFGPAGIDLVEQAVGDHCRVLILGSGGLGLESNLDTEVIYLPPLPSPQVLFETLSALETGHERGMQAGAS